MTTADEETGKKKNSAELAAVLHFYAEAGVDCALNDVPNDLFKESEDAKSRPRSAGPAQPVQQTGHNDALHPGSVRSQAAEPSQPSHSQRPATVPDETAVESAREAAGAAGSIDALREALASFNECNLRFGAKSTVFADGNPEADIMFIGEAPGRDEDRQGLPFVGRAGQLLDRMLQAIGLDRTSSYITNIIPWRPPGNRTPTPLEIELCRPFVEQHVRLVNPKILVFMGNVPTKTLLETNRGILSIRGTWSTYHSKSDTDIPAMPTLHPAYLLRNPVQKRLSWQDFLNVRARLDGMAEASE
ncbi:MAG: uracil-DNA glycosylase [Alphaproteobacteria bacterium]|nr:uracil-DNA glycosylase [Alphaproteobacteria bacterium]